MPNKPEKFSLKFWLLCDYESKYVLAANPYLGKAAAKRTDYLQGEHVIKTLIEPYKDKWHCKTTDNFFTSYKLAEDLLDLDWKITTIGTIRKNKKESSMFTSRHDVYSTFFFEQRDNGCLLTLCQCKKFMSFAVLSTDNDQASIPVTIQIQNKYI